MSNETALKAFHHFKTYNKKKHILNKFSEPKQIQVGAEEKELAKQTAMFRERVAMRQKKLRACIYHRDTSSRNALGAKQYVPLSRRNEKQEQIPAARNVGGSSSSTLSPRPTAKRAPLTRYLFSFSLSGELRVAPIESYIRVLFWCLSERFLNLYIWTVELGRLLVMYSARFERIYWFLGRRAV